MSKKELTYKQALEELENILQELENEDVDIDKMSSMVKRAMELIQFCKSKLMKTKEDVENAIKMVEKNE
jgi:exodeoxyribonuclease VII small subunit